MKVLIAFITTSDPWLKQEDGPAQTVTAALALAPHTVHLLYTSETERNYLRTKTYLEGIGGTAPNVIGHLLDLQKDVTNYHRLKDVLPGTLTQIAKQHIGVNYYLVSGLPQARFIFALCLTAGLIHGVLAEVQRPDKDDPWPQGAEGYRERLEELDIQFFQHFQQLHIQKYKAIRLSLDLEVKKMQLDKKTMDLRARNVGGDDGPRAFRLVVLLAAKMLYSPDRRVSKELIRRFIYRDTDNPDVNIPRSIKKLNDRAKALASIPQVDPLIVADGKGFYSLSERLLPAEERIEITGNLRQALTRMKIREIPALFPSLP